MGAVEETPVLRVALFREGQGWLAQALEHDVGTQAANLRELLLRFAIALDMVAEDGTLAQLPPPPVYFQALWPARAGLYEPDDFHEHLRHFTGKLQFAVCA